MPSHVAFLSPDFMTAAGIAAALDGAPDLTFAGRFSSVAECLDAIAAESADQTLVMIDARDERSYDAVMWFRGNRDSNVKAVLWCHAIDPTEAFLALQCGVRGFVPTHATPEMLGECLRAVCAGDLWLENSLKNTLLTANRRQLTRREAQLLTLVTQGLKNKEIAYTLSVTEGTVKVYLSRLFLKLGVKDRYELTLLGLKHPQISTGSAASLPRTLLLSPTPPPKTVTPQAAGREFRC